jgi:serine/threonine protein kinase
MAQELLTGRAPFADRTPQKMLAAHLSESAMPVSTLRPDCPPGLAALVTQLLRKDPADRPASANDVLRALDAVSTTSSPTLALSAPGALPKVLGLYLLALGAVVEKRLGELYDARKDKTKALAHYGAFVDLWRNADPDVQPVVTTVKKRMAELVAGEGR